MILLVLYAFLAGIVTILSPCILPVLPIVLSGSVAEGKKRPFGIVIGFIFSFTFFTLALSWIVKQTGIPADTLRIVSIVLVALFGLSLVIPQFQKLTERVFGVLSSKASGQPQRSGFFGGILLGLTIGLLWTPCVGPILASVISLAATSTVDTGSVAIMLAYAIGTAIPMFFILVGGRALLNKAPALVANTGKIQKAFGIIMIVVAVALYFNFDRTFQTYILTTFPKYGTGLTVLEDNPLVRQQLNSRKSQTGSSGISNIINSLKPTAPDFIAGGKWFNTSAGSVQVPLTMASLRGKVVVVDFWTYTCINCIRTLPYVEEWYKKYADKGLVIVGVHTPEFEFEKDANNVAKAIRDFGITYPVMQDNNYATWNAYNNQYWPAKYFIDKNGKIRSTHFGEGNYDESEKMIQQLLAETGANVSNIPVDTKTYNVMAQTPETYVGYNRIGSFASSQQIANDQPATYTIPSSIPDDSFAYGGTWTVGGEQASPETGSTLAFNFDSMDVFLVMRPKSTAPSKVKVLLDGAIVGSDSAGSDVQNGVATVADDRLYRLIHLAKPGRHLLQLEFLDANAEVFAFTFG